MYLTIQEGYATHLPYKKILYVANDYDNLSIIKNALLINNSLRGGIRDFGLNLLKQFGNVGSSLEYYEIIPNWKGLFGTFIRVIKSRKTIIYNLGFTSFGNSYLRNFMHFVFVGILSMLGYDFRIILHDSPEIMEKDATIQSLNKIVIYGSRIVMLLLKNTRIYVVSVRMNSLLKNKYNHNNTSYYPFPCDLTVERYEDKGGPLAVFTVGHILPYKGYDMLIPIKKILPQLEIICIGDKSPSLQNEKKYNIYFEKLKGDLINSGLKLTGYLDMKQIQKLLSSYRSIGLLPYSSMSGSSASAIFFVERGIPIISSKLDEFQRLHELGAGVWLAERNAAGFVHIIKYLSNDTSIFRKTRIKDSKYCEKYNYLGLLEALISE